MNDWTRTALLFPGQGSQEVGMGADLAAAYPAAREVFQAADEQLGFALSDLCWHGPEADLNDTINTQPALYVAGIATLRALAAEVGAVTPAYVAGHSLGELTALTAAGALPFADGLRLVRERGRLMKEAGTLYPGAMAAVLGLSAEAITAVCAQASAETGQRLVLANDNCPGQIVISGDEGALARGLELAAEAGAKRTIPLAVSIASHSPLMAPAEAAFRAALAAATFLPPEVPVIGNVGATPLPDVAAIRAELGAQLTSPVRWTESMTALQAAGITRYVELGPKDVLSGLIRRIDRAAERFALNSASALQAFVAVLAAA
ncbi:MAG: ACP S-malonyltransferase [Anaerolineae bacterium]|nr:ACP S-malonyltransferase [Anaerolineae bacterium]